MKNKYYIEEKNAEVLMNIGHSLMGQKSFKLNGKEVLKRLANSKQGRKPKKNLCTES